MEGLVFLDGSTAYGEGILECGDVGVGEVEVVSELRMLAGHRGNALHRGQYAALLAMAAHEEVLLLQAASTGLEHEACYLEVAESSLFHFEEEVIGQLFEAVVALQLVFEVNDALHARDEPRVNLRQLLNALHGVALLQCLCYGEDAQVGGVLKGII